MSAMNENIQSLCETVKSAYSSKQALSIQGANSKLFYGNHIDAFEVSTVDLNGIIEYQPSELYLTAYAGTTLHTIEQTLAEHHQMLSFEPPSYSDSGTLGGVVACGLSGPRRPYADAIRDCILGTNIINGKGEYLSFGGKVMKNVAGYDVSRLMCGALGTLGILTQVSIKVLPKPKFEVTLTFEFNQEAALKHLHQWLNSLIPISATYFANNQLWIRIAGLENSVEKIHQQLGGELIPSSDLFWQAIKNHQHEFFQSDMPLWRCIVPHNTTSVGIEGDSCFEWHGGLRWIKSHEPYEKVVTACQSLRGHATLFRAPYDTVDCFSPMNDQLKKLHLSLKHAFDPAGILNPRRMYSWC